VNLEQQARVIMVTSAVGREGKSTTIANLAIAFARSGRRVALVDLDIRRPFLDRFFRLDPVPGITDVVLKHVPLNQAIRSIPLSGTIRRVVPERGSAGVWNRIRRSLPGTPTPSRVPAQAAIRTPPVSKNGRSAVNAVLSLLPAGTMPLDVGEFVGNPGIALVIEELRQDFDYVFVDAPPLLAVGDSMTLSSEVDAIIAITRLRTLQRPLLHEFARQIEMCRAEKMGFVLTGAELEEGYGYASHYYGYERSPSAADEQRVR
jgi:Mrp family chromosome partitioning ATPase